MIELGAIALAAHLLVTPCHAQGVDNQYDQMYYNAAQLHWQPHRRHLWCVMKAQSMAESGLDPEAVSHAGARGLSQFMPRTWEQYTRRLHVSASPFNPWVSIHAQALYMEDLNRFWSAPRSDWCRMELALASYNAGQGNVLKAQSLNGERCWPGISQNLEDVTGKHAAETKGYVSRINRLYRKLTGLTINIQKSDRY